MESGKAKKVLVILADGCEEIEAVTLIDILRRSTTRVTVAGLDNQPVTGSRRIKLIPDCDLARVLGEEFDALILPGGALGVDKLRADLRVLELIRKMDREKKIIGAICAAPLALRDAGIIQGRHLTSYPNIKDKLEGVIYEEKDIVRDGNLITSRAPGTAMQFSLELVKIFSGESRAKEIAELVLVNRR